MEVAQIIMTGGFGAARRRTNMKRLTEKLRYVLEDCIDCISPIQQEVINRAIDRLATYEDTGLEPEEIDRILDAYGRGMTLRTENAQRLEIVKGIKTTRLRELAQADKEGRCVVMPCEVAEVRHGRWEFLGPNRLIKSCMCGTCSVCHVRSVYIVNTAICPNCGTRMDKENKHKVRCAKCGKIKEMVCTVDGKPWCEDCFDKAMESGTKHETN